MDNQISIAERGRQIRAMIRRIEADWASLDALANDEMRDALDHNDVKVLEVMHRKIDKSLARFHRKLEQAAANSQNGDITALSGGGK